jgi:putative membrane protein
MRGLILRTLITAVGIYVASLLLEGVHVQGGGTVLIAAVVLAVVNAFVRPILTLVTLPLTLLTLGLFLLVINAAMLGLVQWIVPGFQVASFLSAVLGSIIISITSGFANWCIGSSGRVELVQERGGPR